MANNYLKFNNVNIVNGFTIAGEKEKLGRLGTQFDVTITDDKMGKNTFEKGERQMFETAIKGVMSKANIDISRLDALVGGDLLNQIVSSTFAAREVNVPFLGLYNACATFVESLLVGAMLIDNNYKENVVCFSGSHFSTAERQYRYPLELGVLRSPVSQWTATGVGATLLSNVCCPIAHITRGWIGRVIDYGVSDVNNMGAAMAPSAYETLKEVFRSTNTTPQDYSLIATGDLGKLGSSLLKDLLKQDGYILEKNYFDCGSMLFFDEQQTYQGGSGAACSALVFNCLILNACKEKKYSKILLVGTGALMSPLTSFQGESIPTIAHCVQIEV